MNFDELWVDSIGELSFNHICDWSDLQFAGCDAGVYIQYPAEEEDTVGWQPHIKGYGPTVAAGDERTINWYMNNPFAKDTAGVQHEGIRVVGTSTFKKIFVSKKDTSYYIMQGENRTFYLIQSAHLVDSI